MILVESFEVVGHAFMPGPRFGNHHAHGMIEGPAVQRDNFEGFVEHGAVAPARSEHRRELGGIGAEQGALEVRFARTHHVDVAAKRIDFAVVAEIAEGLRQGPGGQGIRAVPLVHERQGCLESLIGQVFVILVDLRGQHKAFVDDCPGRKARHIKVVFPLDGGIADAPFDLLTNNEEFPLEMVDVPTFDTAYKHLLYNGFSFTGQPTERFGISGNIAPPEHLLSFSGDGLFEGPPAELAVRVIVG